MVSAPNTAPESASENALEAAFRATTYRVDTDDGAFDLRIGEANAAFAAFLKRRRVCRWAILTACNPGARPCAEAHNARLQNRLRTRLLAAGWTPGRDLFPALNRADRGDWPDEPGYLLLGLHAAQARALAREFGQLACVHGETGKTDGASKSGAGTRAETTTVPALLWSAAP